MVDRAEMDLKRMLILFLTNHESLIGYWSTANDSSLYMFKHRLINVSRRSVEHSNAMACVFDDDDARFFKNGPASSQNRIQPRDDIRDSRILQPKENYRRRLFAPGR